VVTLLVIAICVVVWLGWFFSWPFFTHELLGGPSMKQTTAANLLLCAVGLWGTTGNRRGLVLGALGAICLYNLFTLIEYIGPSDFGIDLFTVHGRDPSQGRIAISASFAVLVLAGAILALLQRRARWADGLALLAGATGLVGLILDVYRDSLRTISPSLTLAVHTSISLILLSAATLAANSKGRVVGLMTSRSAGGSLARRLVPISLCLPIALAWLRLVTVRGQLLDNQTGLAFLAAGFILVFTSITWWSASSLDRADTARALAREASEQARLQAEEANRAKDGFLAMLGHELRNPLAPIVAALDRMKSFDNVAFAREREILERQAHHLERLVSDLLDVAKISRDSLEMQKGPVSLNKVLDSALEIATPTLKQNGHQPVRESFDTDFWVFGDHARLVQIFVNLLHNASKHTPPNGRITVRLVREKHDVVITVRDAGAGIPKELLPRVFEQFVQEPQTIERRKGGLGLGLAIVRNLAELHGGTATIESPGKNLGTTVTVRLPEIPAPQPVVPAVRPLSVRVPAPDAPFAAPPFAAPPLAAAPLAAPPLAAAPLAAAPLAAAPLAAPPLAANPADGATRVLVVDDNADAAELLSLLLADSGYISMEAYDGEEALRVARDFDPAIVLLDIGLPKLNGYEVAKRLRADPARKGIRLIAITGFGQPKDKLAAEEAGFDLFMVKPVEFAKLQPLMAGLLKLTGS
jgi:signal transduction histidine kinase/CheY-like chemotaxis protein